MITAALLNADDIFIGMEQLDAASQLTDRHLPQIRECDLPINRYRWRRDKALPDGGTFEPLPKEPRKAVAPIDVASLNALALTVWTLHLADMQIDPRLKDWFNAYIQTIDASEIALYSVDNGNGLAVVVQRWID